MNNHYPMMKRHLLFAVCLILLLIIAQRLPFQHDMTASARHTLLPQSEETLAALDGKVSVEIFINPLDPQLQIINSLLQRYQARKPDLLVTVTDPAKDPAGMRKLSIAPGGEVFIRYQDRLQRLTQVSETAITMALQRLAHDRPPIAHFVTGHGERSIESNNPADIGLLAAQLRDSGFTLDTIQLSTTPAPDVEDGLLVIASPLSRFLPAEVAQVLDYVSRGGNLLWLTEPASDDGLKAVALELGVTRSPGVVVDLATENLDVERPDFAVANLYSPHAATSGLTSVTLFPQSAALQLQANREWRAAALVQAGEHSWTETGALSGQIQFGDDQQEISGPFPLIIALEREKAGRQQKVLISGDGDFLADAWIANGGNRDLATRLFHWAVTDKTLTAVSRPTALDNRLELSPIATVTLVAFALLLIPAGLMATAGRVWYSRRYG
jgi:hypothetical protein